jgi:ABC-type Mn2+/Zn2+ transport system permease subunit
MSAFLQAFDLEITRRALLACLLIGFANGYVSAFVVLQKSALKIGTLSHALLPGIALAVLFSGFYPGALSLVRSSPR